MVFLALAALELEEEEDEDAAFCRLHLQSTVCLDVLHETSGHRPFVARHLTRLTVTPVVWQVFLMESGAV